LHKKRRSCDKYNEGRFFAYGDLYYENSIICFKKLLVTSATSTTGSAGSRFGCLGLGTVTSIEPAITFEAESNSGDQLFH
jgi:hypothetical protein